MQRHYITYPDATPTTRPRVDEIQSGDEVFTWDGQLCDYAWFVVMDAVERDGRMKIRIEATTFYFDANLVKDVRINHYVWPHRAAIVTSLLKVYGDTFRVDKYYGELRPSNPQNVLIAE